MNIAHELYHEHIMNMKHISYVIVYHSISWIQLVDLMFPSHPFPTCRTAFPTWQMRNLKQLSVWRGQSWLIWLTIVGYLAMIPLVTLYIQVAETISNFGDSTMQIVGSTGFKNWIRLWRVHKFEHVIFISVGVLENRVYPQMRKSWLTCGWYLDNKIWVKPMFSIMDMSYVYCRLTHVNPFSRWIWSSQQKTSNKPRSFMVNTWWIISR